MAWIVLVPMLGSLAYADSLADAARRERERREKTKGAARVTVIGDEELAAGPRKGSKGTFNPAAGVTAEATPEVSLAPASSTQSAEPGDAAEAPGQVEAMRAAARSRLEASYSAMGQAYADLKEAARQHERECRGPQPDSRTTNACRQRLIDLAGLAVAVAVHMDEAAEAARQGWLSPGEVRDARRRHGMDEAEWDRLSALVRQYRR
jgi:hypothetical protein